MCSLRRLLQMCTCAPVLLVTIALFKANTALAGEENFPKTTLECSTVQYKTLSKADSIKYGPSPKWTDKRLDTFEGRVKIAAEALEKARSLLKECGGEIAMNHFRWIPLGYMSEGGELFFKCQVLQIQRAPDVAARTTTSGQWYTYTNSKRDTRGEIVRNELSAEYFAFELEVMPLVFEQRRFFMESEASSDEGPWAQNPVQALTYVTLHELGHVEAYVAKYSKAWHFSQMPVCSNSSSSKELDNCERAADDFASSVIRCSR
jgi:hypothetical protein